MVQVLKRPGAGRYTAVAQLLHWLFLPMIAAQLVLAWLGKATTGPLSDRFFGLHMPLGLILFVLIVLRLLWRLSHPAPALPGAAGTVLEGIAKLSHWLIYLILIVMPVTGFLMTGGGAVSFFGLFNLPALPKNDSLSDFADRLHLLGQWAVYALLLLHVMAVVFHVALRRDGLLERMLPSQTNDGMN